ITFVSRMETIPIPSESARGRRLTCASSKKDCRDGFDQEPQVAKQRAGADILDVHPHPFVKRYRRTPANLPDAGDPLVHVEATSLPAGAGVHFGAIHGPWADKRHVAHQ